MNEEQQKRYWKKNLKLIFSLLIVWATVSLLFGVLMVETLNQFKIGKLQAGFWFAQQGSIYVFVIIIFVYARRMDKIEREFHLDVQQKERSENQ